MISLLLCAEDDLAVYSVAVLISGPESLGLLAESGS